MNILFQSVKFKPENIANSYYYKYSNGEVKFDDFNCKGKLIREYWINQCDCNKLVQDAPYSKTGKL